MQTTIKYQDTALPTSAADVTLFNSATSFPPGGSFHLLGQQWFQWSLFLDSADSTATGTVTGQYSDDGGSTWNTFYTSGSIASEVEESDEVYVGMFKDVRFTLDVGTQDLSVFRINMALNDCKPTSKVTAAHVLHDDNAAAGPIDIVDVTT